MILQAQDTDVAVYLARSCPMALSQFSIWNILQISLSRMV
jgi:hypothetical protein